MLRSSRHRTSSIVGGQIVCSERLALERPIASALRQSIEVKTRALESQVETAGEVAALLVNAFRSGGKVLLFGNGGSAADAQHVAAEFVNRLSLERDGLPAIALNTDTSVITSVGNGLAFDQIFARQVQALARPLDVVVGISTSGNSINVLNGILAAKKVGATTVGFTGQGGGKLGQLLDNLLAIPSDSVPRVQEVHMTIWHGICEAVDA